MKFLKKYKWGLVFFLMGIIMFFSGTGYLYLVQVEGKFIGSVFIFGGLLTLVQQYFYTKKHGNPYVICEECSKKFKLEHIQIAKCPICDGKLTLYKEDGSNNNSVT